MRDRQKTIVMIVPGFPATEAETDCLPPVQNFVRAVARRNPDVSIEVISFHYPFKSGSYAWHGVTVHALAGRNKPLPIRFRTWLQAAERLRRLIKTRQVIALHSFWLAECSYVAGWVARLTGTKHIASIRGQDALAQNPYLKRLSLENMIITAGSERAAEAFHASTGRSVDHVVPTGLDSEARVRPLETAKRSIDILGVGSLTPIKDYGSFIGIVAKLAPKYPRLRCVIAGEGPERPVLEQKIKETELEEVVRLAGHIPREQVLKTMRNSRIFLHTARYEGQGYVFLEALASGMRIVCRDVGYAGKGGSVYRCKSSDEMLEVLERLLALPGGPAEVEVDGIDSTAGAFEKIYGLVPSQIRQVR